MIRLRRTSVLFLVASLAASQSGCYLTRDALRQERSRLQLELDALRNLKGALADPAFPGGGKHIVVKVGYDMINQVLAGADNIEVPIPQARDAVLHIHEIRMNGQDATPLLNVRASASKYGVRLEVAVTAMLVLDQPDPTQPPIFRVRIQDIAPVLTWRSFTLRGMELARKVLVTKADGLAVNHIAFPVPMEQALRLDIPAVDQRADLPTPRGNGSWVRYQIRKPASTLNRVFRIDRVVFLSDGVHLYATIA
jgi:hypothetical protein